MNKLLSKGVKISKGLKLVYYGVILGLNKACKPIHRFKEGVNRVYLWPKGVRKVYIRFKVF